MIGSESKGSDFCFQHVDLGAVGDIQVNTCSMCSGWLEIYLELRRDAVKTC